MTITTRADEIDLIRDELPAVEKFWRLVCDRASGYMINEGMTGTRAHHKAAIEIIAEMRRTAE